MHISELFLGLNSEGHNMTNHFGMTCLSAQKGGMGALVITRLLEQELWRYPKGEMLKQGAWAP